jgi:hypothetical protein
MAAKKKPKDDSAALAADDGVAVPRLSLGEQGFVGLRTVWGRVIDDPQRAFHHPQFLRTVREMMNDAVIASAINTYRMLLSRVTWNVVPPMDATDEEKARAKFIESCKDDMENSWASFISDVITYLPYGFSVQEKVYRRRLKKNGSKFNDGLVGLRKISPRAQDTIARWTFSEDGRELLGCEQSITNLEHGAMFMSQANEHGLIPIKREKFMLFTADATKGDPTGNSVLKGVYKSWKELDMLRQQELLGIAKESNGLPLIRLPPEYMAEDAPDDKKAVYQACQKLLDTIQAGTNRGIIFPRLIDETSKQDLFDVGLMEKKGIPGSNLDAAIKRHSDEVLAALSVDILKSGNNQGSFSLNDGDTSVIALAMSHRLNEIADVLNNDLIVQLFKLNGWSLERLPKFVPGDISSVSIEEFSKGLQRAASTGTIELDREVLNKVRRVLGIAEKPEDEPVDYEALTTNVSKSGAGMEVGTNGNGTAKIGGNSNGQNQSDNNHDNKA